MILGQFPWRGMQVEADRTSGTSGEVVWLNRTDGTGLGVIRKGQLIPTANLPADDLAPIDLHQTFKRFREAAA